MKDETPTRTLRKTLERALSSNVASTVLFEALSETGPTVPRTVEEVLAVVRGPLRSVLGRRLEDRKAGDLVREIETALTPRLAEPMTVPLELEDIDDEVGPRGADVTIPFSTSHHAVRVVVMAGGTSFSRRLEITLGSARVCTIPVGSPLGMAELSRGEPPAIVVVDASDFPAIEPSGILAGAASLPNTTACVLWGADLPWGKSLARTIHAQPRRWVLLELKEGIPPLLDLIASRRRDAR